jgi:hypothetical protein
VNKCAETDECREWLSTLANDPRNFTIQSSPVAGDNQLGETELNFFRDGGELTNSTIIIESRDDKYKRLGETPDDALAHELGHTVGTIVPPSVS